VYEGCEHEIEFSCFLAENASNSHPFEAEITALLKTPQPEIEFGTEIVDMEMKDSYVWVHSETQLKELVDVLSEERFFAVDTEQHSLRSFLGFTALVQVILSIFNNLSLIAYPRNLFDKFVDAFVFLSH